MNRTINFLDAHLNNVSIEVETTNDYLSFTGKIQGNMGQCEDQIEPATANQLKLLNTWKEKHLMPLPTDEDELEIFIDDIDTILNDVEEEENIRKGDRLCNDISNEEIIEHLISLTNVGDEPSWAFVSTNTNIELKDRIDAPTLTGIALAKNSNISLNDIGTIVNNSGNNWEVQGESFLAGDDSDMDDEWDDNLEQYIDDCILPELPETAQRYFDKESWKNDAKHDGRGHSLNRYDGGEDEQNILGTIIYIYKQ